MKWKYKIHTSGFPFIKTTTLLADTSFSMSFAGVGVTVLYQQSRLFINGALCRTILVRKLMFIFSHNYLIKPCKSNFCIRNVYGVKRYLITPATDSYC